MTFRFQIQTAISYSGIAEKYLEVDVHFLPRTAHADVILNQRSAVKDLAIAKCVSLRTEAWIPVKRSLAVCAARDDSRSRDALVAASIDRLLRDRGIGFAAATGDSLRTQTAWLLPRQRARSENRNDLIRCVSPRPLR